MCMLMRRYMLNIGARVERISVKLECCNFGYYVKVIFTVYTGITTDWHLLRMENRSRKCFHVMIYDDLSILITCGVKLYRMYM